MIGGRRHPLDVKEERLASLFSGLQAKILQGRHKGAARGVQSLLSWLCLHHQRGILMKAKPGPRKRMPNRDAGGNLTEAAKTAIRRFVIESLEDGMSSGKIKLQIRKTYGCLAPKADQLFADGEQQFRQNHVYTAEEVKDFIVIKQMEVLRSGESSASTVNSAAKTLVNLLGIGKETETADYSKQIRLWKDLIDASSIEDMTALEVSMKVGAFDINSITEEAVDLRKRTNSNVTMREASDGNG